MGAKSHINNHQVLHLRVDDHQYSNTDTVALDTEETELFNTMKGSAMFMNLNKGTTENQNVRVKMKVRLKLLMVVQTGDCKWKVDCI